MTMERGFDSWREAYDYACEQIALPEYRGWGWATVEKCDGKWLASIA